MATDKTRVTCYISPGNKDKLIALINHSGMAAGEILDKAIELFTEKMNKKIEAEKQKKKKPGKKPAFTGVHLTEEERKRLLKYASLLELEKSGASQ